jgi:dihydroflavonol-4-reductase
MNQVFVTGGTGFIGRAVVERLRARGTAVRCLVRSPERARHLETPGVELVTGDLDDTAAWQRALGGCSAVIHAAGLVAARRRDELTRINGDAVGRLADACARQPSPPVLVHVSSLAAAGPVASLEHPRTEADPAAPISRYGESKRVGEQELLTRADRLPVTIVRPGFIFGCGDPKFAALCDMVHTLRVHVLMGSRDPALSLMHVDDLVQLLIAAAERGERLPSPAAAAAPGRGIYNACDDREFPRYGDLGRRLARAYGHGVLVLPLPVVVSLPTSTAIEWFWNLLGQASIVSPDKFREARARSWAASAAKARMHLGVSPAATIDERLRETVLGLQARRHLPPRGGPSPAASSAAARVGRST